MLKNPDCVHFNPNAEASRCIAEAFNSYISSGLQVSIVDTGDKEGIWLEKWRFSKDKPEPDFTLIQRKKGQGDCVGGYLRKEFLTRYGVGAQTKCTIKEEGSMTAGTLRIKLMLKNARKIPANKDIPLISFDPNYTPDTV